MQEIRVLFVQKVDKIPKMSVHLSLPYPQCKLYEPDVIVSNKWRFYSEAEQSLFALQMGTGRRAG